MTELHSLNATQILPMYEARKLSPVEVATAVLAQIAKWEPHLNATFDEDKDAALRMARESEARWQRGEPCGALDGVPVSIKDNIAITGRHSPVGTAFAVPRCLILACLSRVDLICMAPPEIHGMSPVIRAVPVRAQALLLLLAMDRYTWVQILPAPSACRQAGAEFLD